MVTYYDTIFMECNIDQADHIGSSSHAAAGWQEEKGLFNLAVIAQNFCS